MKEKVFKTTCWDAYLEYVNGDLKVNGKKFEKSDMKKIASDYKGMNRIHKPMALLFWIDCNNGKQSNWNLK